MISFKELYDFVPWPDIIQILIALSPIIVTIILGKIFWSLWVSYVQAEFFFNQKYTTLEVKLPRELLKSPLSMELFLSALHQTSGEGTWYDKFWLGKTRPWFSLEMISVEGQVKFIIWTRTSFKGFIETALYANFPGIEVYEIPDYSLPLIFDKDTYKIWGAELELTKPDPYPIKTYVDYGLDKDPKEEFKIDPLSNVLEFLGSVGPNQQVWIQILIRAHKKEYPKSGSFFKKTDAWQDEAKEIINEIMVRDSKTKVSGEKNEAGFPQVPTLSSGEQDLIKAIERSISKIGFDTGIRMMYIAKKELFNPSNISGLTGIWKQFGSENLNGFKPNSKKWSPIFSYPWQDYKEMRHNAIRGAILEAYKRRSYFYGPFESNHFVLNSEELATIYHFPGDVIKTPTLTRVPSKKYEAPSNLPI